MPSYFDIRLIVFILSIMPVMITGFYLFMRKRHGYDIFEPYTFFCFPSLLIILINGIYTLCTGGVVGTIYFPIGSDEFMRTYIFTGILHSVCILAFTIGYERPKRGWKKIKDKMSICQDWNRNRLIFICLLFSAIGFIAVFKFVTVLNIRFDTIASWSSKRSMAVYGGVYDSAALGYHRWAASLLNIVFIFTASFIFSKYKKISFKYKIILLGLFGAGSLLPFIASERGKILWFIIMLLVIIYYTRGGIKLKTLLLYGILFLLIFTVMASLRHGERDPDRIIKMLTFSNAMEKIGTRISVGYVNITNIILTVPNFWEYQMGKTMISWLVAPIPRQYWPEKPLIEIGEYIKVYVYNRDRRMGGAVPTNSIGEFYINFGILGMPFVVLWWGLGGIISRKAYFTLKPFLASNPTALVLYCVIVFNLFPKLFIDSISVSIMNFLKWAVPVGIALSFVTKRVYTNRS